VAWAAELRHQQVASAELKGLRELRVRQAALVLEEAGRKAWLHHREPMALRRLSAAL
jgi:hypothetical protein